VTSKLHDPFGAPDAPNADQGPQQSAQNLLQVASKVSDLAARVDDLEQQAAWLNPK